MISSILYYLIFWYWIRGRVIYLYLGVSILAGSLLILNRLTSDPSILIQILWGFNCLFFGSRYKRMVKIEVGTGNKITVKETLQRNKEAYEKFKKQLDEREKKLKEEDKKDE